MKKKRGGGGGKGKGDYIYSSIVYWIWSNTMGVMEPTLSALFELK